MDREPVSDWASDFDIFDPGFVANPYPVFDELRGSCPIAHTERWGGQGMPVTYEDIAAITADTDHFSSVTVGVTGRKPGEGTILTAPPIDLDPRDPIPPPGFELLRWFVLPSEAAREVTGSGWVQGAEI